MNGLLLDTQAFLWALSDPNRLSPAAQDAIADAATRVFVSAATAWEIAIKQALGRLTFPIDRFAEALDEKEFTPLPIAIAHALRAGSLPRHHADPFDRMLVAQAQIEGLQLATADAALARYEVQILAL